MSMSEEQSHGDQAPEAKTTETPEMTSNSEAETRAAEDHDPTTEATPKKRLASGREAALLSVGPSPEQLATVCQPAG